MKKFKLFLGLIFVIFIALLIYQNRVYFLAQEALSFSLGVETWHWTAPPVQNVAYMGICLAFGFLFAGIMGLSAKLKSKKAIKLLHTEKEQQLEEISELKKELAKFTADPYQKTAPEPVSVSVDDDIQNIDTPPEKPADV